MTFRFSAALRALLPALALLSFGAEVAASGITQNASWTVNRSGTTTKYRVVAYGDSIYAGYNTSLTNVAKYSAPTVQAEYLSAAWNADIESIRRTKSGALAKEIYDSKIVSERSYMQNSSTRVVAFEMCGNDGLQNRADFDRQTGTCSYAKLDSGTESCRTYVARAMDYINANAYSGVKLKIIGNLHYPGLDAYNKTSSCRDASTGRGVNISEMMLRYAAKVNWFMGDFARQKGFVYVDNFAQYHAADYDTNGDGLVDSEAIKYVPGESEQSYVTRITQTLRSTIKDANVKRLTASTSIDYIQSDDIHPTYTGGNVSLSFGTGTGSAAPRYTSFTGGKSPIWDRYAHERSGWSMATSNPSAP
ncbi:MAG: SGNH/GDSL hydrolase family protein [Rhizobacter sp.]|nr:SGNH/GDSL hydrolase family protein [Rhizobacter sp.]